MADIMGVSVKGVKNSIGHEGESCPYGSLYIDGHKIGTFSYDTWGGSTIIRITEPYEEEFNKRVASYFKKYVILCWGEQLTGTDIFIEDLVNFADLEKEFGKTLKKYQKKYGEAFDASTWRTLCMITNSMDTIAIRKEFFTPTDAEIKRLLAEHRPDFHFILSEGNFSIN